MPFFSIILKYIKLPLFLPAHSTISHLMYSLTSLSILIFIKLKVVTLLFKHFLDISFAFRFSNVCSIFSLFLFYFSKFQM